MDRMVCRSPSLALFVVDAFVWAGITAQFGWSLPRQVDEWREQEAVAGNASRPTDGANDERRA